MGYIRPVKPKDNIIAGQALYDVALWLGFGWWRDYVGILVLEKKRIFERAPAQ